MKKKKKIKIISWLPHILLIGIGAICGYFGGRYIGHQTLDLGDMLFRIAGILILIYIASYIQIIVHEGGHLIAALLSGYSFVSFRVGKYMVMKKEGKYIFKKQVVAGTGGQCLMMPPKEDPYNYPCTLYNLGGISANFIVSLISLGISLAIPVRNWVVYGLFIFSAIGMIIILMNGIPMRIGGIANDGYNTLYLRKDRESRYALWIQLYIHAALVEGKKLEDIPTAYYEFPEGADLDNPLVCAIGVFKCNYLHSIRDFEGAKKLSYKLFEEAKGMLAIYKNELTCELLFHEVIGECRKEEIDRFYTKKLKKYIQITSTDIVKRRILYAYELLVRGDEKEAKKQYEAFEKLAKYYPYEGELENERELVNLVGSIGKRELEQ